MSSNGKRWSWAADAGGRKVVSEAMTVRLKAGKVGRSFEAKHGLAGTPSYNSWKKMMARCYNASNPEFKGYGGRGIVVCERWHSVVSFVEDMGMRAKGLSLERIDVNGNYEPRNCCWIPLGLQSKNRREWQHTEEGRKIISESRKRDWENGVYDAKVAAQRSGMT